MSDNESDVGAFLSGFVIGGLVGAAVALILAPQSGETTRSQIRERGIELRDQAIEQAEEARKLAEETAAEARARAEKLAAEARARATELQERGRVVIEEQRGRIEAALDTGKKPDKPAASGDTPAPAAPAS